MENATLEELIAYCEDEGFRLNNLFQLDDGSWQANLRSDDENTFHEFGQGPTHREALVAAMLKIN